MTEKNLTTASKAETVEREATRSDQRYITPAVDIYETDEGLVLTADVPGLDDKSLQINVDQGVLTIEGGAVTGSGETLCREFAMAGYWRQFHLPDSINANQATAEVKNGVLTLHLPKAEAAKPKRIEVTVH
jgi:HSP20 family molecular chaperone IbpA